MPRCFFDTNALVKNHHVESGPPQVQAILANFGFETFISRPAAVEILSGPAGKVRTGILSSIDQGTLCLVRDRDFGLRREESGGASGGHPRKVSDGG